MVIIVPKSGSHLTQCTRLLCSSFRRCSVKNTYAPAPRTQVYSHLEQVSHMSSVIGKFITYPENDFSLFIEPFLKVESTEELRTFGDLSLLIREPALSVIKDLINIRTLQKNSFNEEPGSSNSVLLARYSAPRFVLHGQPGTGISTTLGQITCFSGNNKWLIFPFVSCEDLLEPSTDIAPSNDYHFNQHHDSSGDTLDFPARSAEWLKFFLKINRALLEELRPVISRQVEWTKKDLMPEGTSWVDLISFCIARTKYSTDCIGILLREMRAISSASDGPPCLLVIDGVNFMWCRGTLLKDKTLAVRVTPDRLSIVHHLKRALKGDWRHGAIVTSTNIRAAWPTDREKYTPGYLLGKSGFECMDPFVPVLVENYTPTEIEALLRFYAENNWLTNPAAFTPDGRAELIFLSDHNPLELSRVAAEW
uniref:Small ribosomal subunit protein mS29 n=1 Tax=Schistosoma japonicum TaxID=6182 RepID=C1L4Y1_SCHJA|nr:Mitochondrial 28S ribosomal protein S29 [Schistosoma japonicum]